MATILSTANTREELLADLERSGHTLEDFRAALVSVSSYAIEYALFEMREQIRRMEKVLRNDDKCSRLGYKKELNAVLSAVSAHMQTELLVIANEYERIRVMQVETHEYMTDHIQRMYYGAYNWLGFHHFPNPQVMAEVFIAICICNMTCELIDERIAEVEPYHQTYGRKVVRLKPIKIAERLQQLAAAIERCYPGADDCDINDCQALRTGTLAIKAQIFDIDLMELHCAFGIEQSEGEETLRRNEPNAYKILHPNYGN